MLIEAGYSWKHLNTRKQFKRLAGINSKPTAVPVKKRYQIVNVKSLIRFKGTMFGLTMLHVIFFKLLSLF